MNTNRRWSGCALAALERDTSRLIGAVDEVVWTLPICISIIGTNNMISREKGSLGRIKPLFMVGSQCASAREFDMRMTAFNATNCTRDDIMKLSVTTAKGRRYDAELFEELGQNQSK